MAQIQITFPLPPRFQANVIEPQGRSAGSVASNFVYLAGRCEHPWWILTSCAVDSKFGGWQGVGWNGECRHETKF